ncbi:hypothetical protein [Roseomonas chloroacetimidivorans]|uniref:hypothetical protein n=1 Tax=Roseomonas chloroacetimidivorans TaxID=1766656 RepID=UPI003C70AC69
MGSRFVSDGDVRAALSKGGRIEKVIVLAMRDAHGRADFVPYLGTSWRRGYVAIGLWSGAGARAWRDLTRLVSFMRDDFKFPGPICVHEADDPKLRKLRTLLPSPNPTSIQGQGSSRASDT